MSWVKFAKFTYQTSHSVYCPSGFSVFEHAHTMKRRVEDQELVFAPQQQQTHHPAVQSIAESFQQRTLITAPAIIEASTDNMQPSTGIQYSLSHSYQVWVGLTSLLKKTGAAWSHRVFFTSISAPNFQINDSFFIVLKNATAHGHSHNAATLVGPHGHSLTVAQAPTVVQGPVHPPTSITTTQGQQQFQRLKVRILYTWR